MSIRLMLSAALLGAAAVPAFAQTTPQAAGTPATTGAPLETGRSDATSASRSTTADPAGEPTTADLNATSALGSAIIATTVVEDKEQYELDRQAYWAALIQHDRSVQRTDARWVRQQNAYADAMAAWRLQVAECKRGNRKACDRPTPTPDQFY